MRFELVRNLKSGETLGKDIYNSEGKVLLKKGIILTRMYINLLKQNGIHFIYIKDEYLEDIKPSDALNNVKSAALKDIPDIFKSLADYDQGKIEKSLRSVENLVNSIIKEDNVNTNLFEINQYDNYTYIHCIDTGIMSIILGKALGLMEEELKILGIGALLHDIGKIKISEKIINKRGPLSSLEFEEIKKHPVYGYEILKKAGISDKNILSAVWAHHEKVDGTGYPFKIKGNNISQFAKIVSICDVFTAISANRSYRARFSPNEAYEYIISGMNTFFDEVVVRAFRKTFSIYPLGCCVRLSDGVEGYVVRQNKYYPDRPIIRICYDYITRKIAPTYEIDLLEHTNLVIREVV